MEPESKEERQAMALLYDGFRKTTLWERDEKASETAVPEQDIHRIVGNLEPDPIGVTSDLLDK